MGTTHFLTRTIERVRTEKAAEPRERRPDPDPACGGHYHQCVPAGERPGAADDPILLWLALRRFGDVLRPLIPLLVSAVVTLELCVAFGMPLNFANIIALPLMLGIGVAFQIDYVMAWRSGRTGLLQWSLTHALLFSAATTGTAFGSRWLSHHPGTSNMGGCSRCRWAAC